MKRIISTSISFPQDALDRLEKKLDLLKKHGLSYSKSAFLVACVRLFLLDTNLGPGERLRATRYNPSAGDFSPMGVRWSVEDYNSFKSRGHATRMSVSYMFFLAFEKYCNILIQSLTDPQHVKYSLSGITRANYFFEFHAAGQNFYGLTESVVYNPDYLAKATGIPPNST